jgi:HlyD family secretion protein
MSVSEDARPRGGAPSLSAGTVWIVKDKKLVRGVAVKTGISDGSWSELVSGDVASGDELGVAALASGSSRPRRGPF